MKKILLLIMIMLLASFSIIPLGAEAEDNKWTRLVEESGKVLGEIQEMPDQGIPEDLMRNCSAIAVFPSTISAGFIVGGQYGQGIIMARSDKDSKWSPPAVFNIVGGSFGWQIGGQATDFVLLVMNRRSLDGILQGKFKLGADASVAAGPVGRDAAAAADIQLKGGILSYSRSRGLFAGVKLDGAVVTENLEGNQGIYGKSFSAEKVLIKNKAAMPESAGAMLKVLSKYKKR